MIAGSLFSAFTVGLAITFTLPWLANALRSPVKSLMCKPTVIVPPPGRRDGLRQRHGIAGALEQKRPVDAGGELVVQHDLDDLRLNPHLPRRPVVHGVEVQLDLIEPLGIVGRLQQRGLPVHVEAPFGDRSVCTPAARSVKTSAASVSVTSPSCPARSRQSGVHAGAPRADRIRRRQRPRPGAPRHHVVQVETARFEPTLEDTDQVALHRIVVSVRLQDHVERLPQRHVLQLASECSLTSGSETTLRRVSRTSMSSRSVMSVGSATGDRDRPHVVQIAALRAFIELRHDERPERALTRRRRLRRTLRGSLRRRCEQHRSRCKTDFHAPRFGSRKAKP